MASDVSSGCTNELFDDEKEEGEISLEDVSSSEEGQLYKYPPRTYRGQCPQCLSMQHCATWCRSLTVNKVNNVKRDGGVQGKENRRNQYYDKEPVGLSNVHGKHASLYSTLQEKNDEGQNDLVPISSDSDMELVGLEPTKKEKKHRKLHKKRRKKSPLPSEVTLALSVKESIHRLECGLFKKDAGSKSSHSRVRYSPDKKSVLPVSSQQRRHSRLSPVMMRPRRPRSPLLRKPSPPLRQRKLPPQAIPVDMNEEVDLPLEQPSSRGSVNKLLKKVRNLEPFSSRTKEKGSSLKDKLINIIKSDKKESSTEEIICKENKSTETVVVKRECSKNEIKNKDLNKKKEKDIEKVKEKDREKDKSKEKEKSKEHDKEKTKEKVKEKEHEKDKAKEKVKQKEHEKVKAKERVRVKGKEREKDKVKDKVNDKEKGKEKVKEKARENVKEKVKKNIKEKDTINEIIKIKEEKEEKEEQKSLKENVKDDDDDDLIVLRQIALETKQKRNTLLRPDEIKIEPIDHDEEEEMQGNKYPKMPNFCMDDNDEDLQLRMIALRSAVIKKHRTRMQFGLKKKQTKNQQKEQQESMVPRMESPFTASFIEDFPLLAEICSPSSPLSKKDSLSVEDMVLDSDMELTAISEDESPYSPSDVIAGEIADSNLYTPSKPTETPYLSRSNVKPPMNNMNGSFLEFVNQESRPYSPTDITIYDPDLPGVHSSTDTPSVVALTPPQMQHTQPLHSTPSSQPAPPLQPPPLPPLSMFTTPVAMPDQMVLGCPPNMLNPFVDPTLANFPVNPMMLPPPQMFTPFTSLPPPAPSLPTTSNQLDDFGETDLDGSPLVPIEKDGQQQQQWRLLNEPLYLQDLPPLGEAPMNKMSMLTAPNLVPTAVLKTNKQLQKQPLRKSPASDNSLFRNAEMTPVVIEPDVSKAGAMFKPMKLQSSAKKKMPLQPAAVFNSTVEDADISSTIKFNADSSMDSTMNSSMEKTRDLRKSVTPSPSEHKRKRSKRERRAAKRANLRERMRTVKTISTTNNETEVSKSSDKRRRNSVDDDEQILREILLASMAKRIKEQPDKGLSTAEPSTSSTNTVDAEKPKTSASSADATKQTAISKSNNTDALASKNTDANLTPISTPTISPIITTISTSSVATITTTPTSSSEATSSTASASTTIKVTNNLKRPTSALGDAQPLSKIARKAASTKVVNNAKRYQNLLLQRKLAQQKNSSTTSTVTRFKVTNNGSLPQRSISPNVANLESNRLVINLNEDTESESEKDEVKLSPTKNRPQLSIPETEFEKNLNQFLKCARQQHEMAAASAITGTTAEATENAQEPETTVNSSTFEKIVSSSTPEITANSTVVETASSTAVETSTPVSVETASSAAAETTSLTSTTTVVSSTTSTLTVSTPASKISDTAVVTTSPKVPCTSKAVEINATTSKVTSTNVNEVKISTDITQIKNSTIMTTPIAKTSINTVTKLNASTAPVKVTAGQVTVAVKVATTTVTKNDSSPKISTKTLSNPALTPVAVQHLPPSQLEEYRRLKQRIYEYERLKRLKAKELGVSVPTNNPALKISVNNAPTPSPSVKSPPSLTALALASSTLKPTSKPLVAAVSESPVSATTTSSIPAVSTSSVTISPKPTITADSASSITTDSKSLIKTVSSMPDKSASKLPVESSTTSLASAVSVKTSVPVTTPSASIASAKPIVATSKKSATIVSSSISKPLSTVVSKITPKPQLVATISPMAKSSRTETSPIVLITPTKIVHSTAASASLVKSVPSKTATVSNVATSRNTIVNNSPAATSSQKIIPQSTQESPTKLLDKMNAALNNQRLQISAFAHKVSSLKILTREQINHKSSQNQETTRSTSTVNLNLNRINKEATNKNNNVSKVVVENPPVIKSNHPNKSLTEVNVKQSRAPDISASAENTKNSWEDFKHEVNNEVQSLTDLATEEQRILLRDTEEKLINKRHLVLDDITEMSSNLRQWEIERDLQNMLSAEVKKLREQLRIAEEKMQQQKEKLNSIQPKVSSYHEKINAGRKECFRLSKICTGLGQQVIGPSYKVPTAGAELLNNRIKEVANHTQKLKSKKAQLSGTLKNNNSQKTDKRKLNNNPKLNTSNLRPNEINSRQNNINSAGASLPNNHVNTNSNARTIGFVESEDAATVSNNDNRVIKEEIITDESSDEDLSANSFNNDLSAKPGAKNVNNSVLNTENIRTDKSLNNYNDSNACLTTDRLNSNVDNSSISNTQSENYFNPENENLHNLNNEPILNVNQNLNASDEKINASSLKNKISSRENNESIDVEQTNAFTSENNVQYENLNSVSDNNVENPQNEIINQNLFVTTDTDNNANNLNGENENSAGNIICNENSENESSFEQNALVDVIAGGASINGNSNKNVENETTAVLDNVERTQQNELCPQSNGGNVNTIIQNIKRESEMEVDSGVDSVLQSMHPQAENVEYNNNTEDVEEFADSKLNETIKKTNEESCQSEFLAAPAGSEHSTLLEEINLLEIANAVEVPHTFTRYSQMFKKKKRPYRSLMKPESVKEDSKKKKVPRPYESILKHLNVPRNNKTDGILCPYELMGTCYDGDCQYIHQSTSHS